MAKTPNKQAEKSVAASDLAQARTPGKQTTPKVAAQASKVLTGAKSTKGEKSVAASDLSQAGGKKKK